MRPDEYRKLRALEDTHWWYQALYRRVLDKLNAALVAEGRPQSAPRFFLDAGCGTGGFLRFLRLARPGHGFRETLHLYGVDRSILALGLTGDGLLSAQADIGLLPFRSEWFDGVVSLDVLNHAEVRDDVAALREFHRVLKPAGILVMNLPAHPRLLSAHDRAVCNVRRYRREELRAKLVEAGWRDLQIEYWNSTLLLPAMVVRLWKSRWSSGGSDLYRVPAPLNTALRWWLEAERVWAKGIPFPTGLSLLVTGRKGSG